MSGQLPAGGPGDVDPLPASVVGAVLATAGTLAWPPLRGAVLCLSVLATVIVWMRAVRMFRTRRSTGYEARRLWPLAAVGLAGWLGAGVAEAIVPSSAVWSMMALAVSLWPLSRVAGVLH